tara:strand:- start:1923 stop:2420 length:498 start_codon:yes stop_codon:yes gene_type:complete
MPASRFRRFPREQVDAAMSARRAASSMRAEVDTLTRAGGAVQLLLRSEKERADDDARALREATGPYCDALKRYCDGDAVRVNSVRPPKPAEPLPIAHSAYCELLWPRLGGRCSGRSLSAPHEPLRVALADGVARDVRAAARQHAGPTALAVRARVPLAPPAGLSS